MKISKVENSKQFREFVRFPWKIYSKDSPWVPPLISDAISILSENKNPFWLHAQRELFLSYDDNGKVTGRIAAIIDYNYINFQDDNCGFFGFFECIDDEETAKALFDAVKAWLKEKNINRMMGPMNPSTNDECGFLSEGFDLPPSLMMTYTPEYYLKLAEKSGLKRIKELYAYSMDVVSDQRIARLEKVVQIAKKRMPTLKVRNLLRDSFKEDLKSAISIYNRAWDKNWAFVPWSDEEFAALAAKIKPLLDPGLIVIASVAGAPVGMIIAMPDYNQVLKKLNGSLLPTGMFKFLYYKNKIDSVRLLVIGVIKEYRNKGIEAIMAEKAFRNAIKKGYKKAELSWVMDDNIMSQRTAEMMGGKIYKKYSIFQCKND